jgi:hypothetical protein
MTLLLTEISRYGIAMAADSALSVPTLLPVERQYIYRVYFGATKLRPIPKLQAGISWWGEGKIGGVDTDVWLLDFIHRNEAQYNTLRQFAILLRNQLREQIRPIPTTDGEALRYGSIGFHLAGFTRRQNSLLPTFWHIHNGQSERYQDIDPTLVNANNDIPPQTAREELARPERTRDEDWLLIRNGEFQTVYAPFYQVMRELTRFLRTQRTVIIPAQSLKGRAEFLAFQIRAIRDLYGMSQDLLPSVGGNVAILTISQNRIQNYFNPYDTTL